MLTLILLLLTVVGLLAVMRREAGAMPTLILLGVLGLAGLLLGSPCSACCCCSAQ